jgi:peroxiredoxin Q/BCP
MRTVTLIGFVSLVLASAAVASAQAPAPAAAPPAVELKVGEKAPNFKLQGSDGKTHNLADFVGKQAVVLAWFPAAFTGGCTIECKSLAEHGDMIKKYDVTYFMASTDSIEKNTEFANATTVKLKDR